jgi:hypothetical protein
MYKALFLFVSSFPLYLISWLAENLLKTYVQSQSLETIA